MTRSRLPDLLAEGIVPRMLAGIFTRRYPISLEPVGEQVTASASGTSKSAVSRRLVTATAERLAALCARPLGDQRWLIVFIDGFRFADHTMIGALGVTADGTKVPLGVVEGQPRTPRSALDWWPTAAESQFRRVKASERDILIDRSGTSSEA